MSLTVTQAPVTSLGGAGVVTVSTQPECAWTATADASWISGVTPTSGQGDGEVRFQVAANPTAASRQGNVILNGSRALITQPGLNCSVDISPVNQDLAAGGGTGNFTVNAPSGCSWSASSDAPWLVITSGASGSGNGSVAFSVAANAGGQRAASIGVSGQSFLVNQAAAGVPVCQYTIQPTTVSIGAGGGTAPITIQTNGSCSWTSTNNPSWITFSGASAGSGNGTVTINASANTGNSRSGTVIIAGQTLTVTEAGSCALAINPVAQSVAAAGGNAAQVTVTTASGCGWTSTSNDNWITITNGANGSGNGAVTFTVAANGGAARSGTLTIGGQTHTVDQASGCAVAINPVSQSVAAAGSNSAQVTVTAGAGCAWSSVANANWITVLAGASGTGNGTVTLNVDANASVARSGTVTIGGQVHTINQGSGCSVGINPASQSFPTAGGNSAPVNVTAASGCGWTSVPNVNWITITAGASGSGNGTVTYSVAANSGVARSGTVTIGGQVHTVNQATGCSYSLSSTTLSLGKGQSTGRTVNVTTTSICTWTATSNASWLTITGGSSGSGNGTVTFDVAQNSTGVDRVGTLTIAGITFTVSQGK